MVAINDSEIRGSRFQYIDNQLAINSVELFIECSWKVIVTGWKAFLEDARDERHIDRLQAARGGAGPITQTTYAREHTRDLS